MANLKTRRYRFNRLGKAHRSNGKYTHVKRNSKGRFTRKNRSSRSNRK